LHVDLLQPDETWRRSCKENRERDAAHGYFGHRGGHRGKIQARGVNCQIRGLAQRRDAERPGFESHRVENRAFARARSPMLKMPGDPACTISIWVVNVPVREVSNKVFVPSVTVGSIRALICAGET